MQRDSVRIVSGDVECAAWHYPRTNGACVVMAGGFSVNKEPGTDRFARRFHQAGYTVLAFDYRNLGESGGTPRQVLRIPDQLDDWDRAIAYARTLADRVAVWGFSLSGGHIFTVAARNPDLAAAIAQTPNADGPAATRNAATYQTVGALARLTGRGIADTIGGWFGREPLLVPLTGARGTVAMLTTPDAQGTDEALDPDGVYSDWSRTVAARSVLKVGFYRPGKDAARVRCPLLVVVCDDDRSALAAPAITAAGRAPRGELLRIPGGHYEPFLGGHETVVDAELAFLGEHLH